MYGNKCMQQIHQLIIYGIDSSVPRLHVSTAYFFFWFKMNKKDASNVTNCDQLSGLLHTRNHYNKEYILSAMPNLIYILPVLGSKWGQ